MQHPKKNPLEEAKKYGIDTSLLEHNLSLTYEQRLIEHQRALDMMRALQKAGKKINQPVTTKEIKKLFKQQQTKHK